MHDEKVFIYNLECRPRRLLLEEEAYYECFNVTHCPLDNEHIMCDIPYNINKRFKVNRLKFRENEKMIWSWLNDCIIRDDLLAEFKAQGFTGFESYGVTIYNKAGQRIDNGRFLRLVITGWGGHARLESGIKLLSKCPGCNRQIYSMYKEPRHLFDREKWDGSDFFMIWPLPKYIFITDRVAKFFKCIKLEEYRLIPIDKLPVYDFFDDLIPGRLSQFLPDELARKYGQENEID